jgi:cobalt/nickel transport system ATP-binding protein
MLLEAYDLSYRYPDGVLALRNAYFSIDRGEIVAVVGSNGSGKTTLLLSLAGLIEPTGGIVLFEGKPLLEQLPGVRKRIGVLFQNPDDQLFNPTVFDEIAFALKGLNVDRSELEVRVEMVASRLGLLDLLDRRPYRLSFGEKKLVSLASILVYDPDVLLLDEPFSGLTSDLVNKIVEVVWEYRSRNKCVVLAEHDMDLIARLADRVYIMAGGTTVAEGRPEDIFYDENLLSSIGLATPLVVRIARSLGLDGRRILTLDELLSELDRTVWKRLNLGD